MNDPITYFVAGAAIALVCATAGVTGGVWLMKEMGDSDQRTEVRSQKPAVSGMLAQ